MATSSSFILKDSCIYHLNLSLNHCQKHTRSSHVGSVGSWHDQSLSQCKFTLWTLDFPVKCPLFLSILKKRTLYSNITHAAYSMPAIPKLCDQGMRTAVDNFRHFTHAIRRDWVSKLGTTILIYWQTQPLILLKTGNGNNSLLVKVRLCKLKTRPVGTTTKHNRKDTEWNKSC